MNPGRTDAGATPPSAEASASSSAGSSASADAGPDAAGNRSEEAEFSLESPGQFAEDKEKLDTKKDEEFD